MDITQIKHKLRRLKRLEAKMKYGCSVPGPLVWDSFFDLSRSDAGRAKYSLDALAQMDREAYKKAIDEYWAFVCRALFDAPGASGRIRFDAEMLLRLDLPPDADGEAVKKRFRELAKQHHPDAGGSAEEFVELMRAYKKLTGK